MHAGVSRRNPRPPAAIGNNDGIPESTIPPSDAERVLVADKLRQAVVDGLLPFDELEPRLDAAFGAQSIGELEQLVRFLPASVAPPPTSRTRKGFVTKVLAVGGAIVVASVAFAVAFNRSNDQPTISSGQQEVVMPPVDAEREREEPPVASARTTDNLSAIISIDVASKTVEVEQALRVVSYPVCADFEASNARQESIRLADLRAGDFGRTEIDSDRTCLRNVALEPAPSADQCVMNSMPGAADVVWKGFNADAQSVLFQPTGDNQSVLAQRWCKAPVVADARGKAIPMNRIPVDSMVRLISRDNWLMSVEVLG